MSARRSPDRRARGRASRRLAVFAALCVLCLVIGGGYVTLAARRASAPPATSAPVDRAALAALSVQPHLLFLSTAVGPSYGKVALASLDAPAGERVPTALQCDRVYFAGGNGFCLGNNVVGGFLSSYSAYSFADDYMPRFTFNETGIPSRVRVSPDGRLAASTVFVAGHGYDDAGFSTYTALRDLTTGELLGDLEQFAVWRDGARFEPVDRNFWGVTFTPDSQRFYATMGTGGQTYLVEGQIAAREMRVSRPGVACPSLSPDGTRLAYKRQVGSAGRPHWTLHVLDLATGAETALTAETRSVDDQVEWLDDSHLLYALAPNGPPRGPEASIWRLPLSGDPPTLFVPNAYSPAVVRPPASAQGRTPTWSATVPPPSSS
jgi:hypothetical protein